MKRIVLFLALAACGCSAFSSALDAQATAANKANVDAIVGQNEGFLATDPRPASLKAADHARNVEAAELAAKMAAAK